MIEKLKMWKIKKDSEKKFSKELHKCEKCDAIRVPMHNIGSLLIGLIFLITFGVGILIFKNVLLSFVLFSITTIYFKLKEKPSCPSCASYDIKLYIDDKKTTDGIIVDSKEKPNLIETK